VNDHLRAVSLLVSCVTPQIVTVGGGYHPSPEPHLLRLGSGNGAALRGSLGEIRLTVTQFYRIASSSAGREVDVVGYGYAVQETDGAEILVFHLHPEAGYKRPHLHLGSRYRPDPSVNAHVPTGLVPLADVVRFLIADLGVPALRPDWGQVLS
jgi:hypothetical protein